MNRQRYPMGSDTLAPTLVIARINYPAILGPVYNQQLQILSFESQILPLTLQTCLPLRESRG